MERIDKYLKKKNYAIDYVLPVKKYIILHTIQKQKCRLGILGVYEILYGCNFSYLRETGRLIQMRLN